MKIVTSRTFRNGNSEAVRLPSDMAFGIGTEVEIVKQGDSITIRRKPTMTPRELVEALAKLPKPSKIQEREPIEFPERPGL